MIGICTAIVPTLIYLGICNDISRRPRVTSQENWLANNIVLIVKHADGLLLL